MSLCQYKDMFGKPNEGSHAYRIPGLDVAAVDVFLTLLVALIIVALTGSSVCTTILYLFLASIFAHRMFGVKTKVDRFLFCD